MPARERTSRALPKVSARQRAHGDHAVDQALAPLAFGEAARIGLIGDTGSGKTRAAQAIVTAYLRRSPGMVLVVDTKDEGRYSNLPGAPAMVCASPADYASSRARLTGARVLVFRGSPFRGEDCDPDEVCRMQWGLAERRWPSLLVSDELTAATTHGQWRSGVKWLPRSFVQGRTKGVSQLWGTTSPLEVPAEPFDESQAILCFKMAGNPLRLLQRRDYLRGVPPGLIEGLAGMPLPPAQRGEFLLLKRGCAWDGYVYKFPA